MRPAPSTTTRRAGHLHDDLRRLVRRHDLGDPRPLLVAVRRHRDHGDGLRHRRGHPGGGLARDHRRRLDDGPNKVFFVFTPRNVGSCYDSSSAICAYSAYCAYHSYFVDSHLADVLYANHPYTDTAGVGRARRLRLGRAPEQRLGRRDDQRRQPRAQRGDHRPRRLRLVRLERQRERRQVRLDVRHAARARRRSAPYNQAIDGRHVLPAAGVEQRDELVRAHVRRRGPSTV